MPPLPGGITGKKNRSTGEVVSAPSCTETPPKNVAKETHSWHSIYKETKLNELGPAKGAGIQGFVPKSV